MAEFKKLSRSPLVDGPWQREMYTDEEAEFLRAIDRFRIKHHRIPTEVEALRIAKRLGWTKTADREARK